MAGTEPIEKQGQIRWFKKPKAGCTYMVGLDPSLGTGGDNAAIQILELPSFIQVGEWQHNRTPIHGQIRLIKAITDYLYDIVGTEHNIYYSIENNGIGEAAIIAVTEFGEENIKGVFMSETKSFGFGKTVRRGFTTTHSSKITACTKLKQLIENKRITVSSKNLISELKTFVAVGNTFKARVGDTDDLVSAFLLITRMLQNMQNYDVGVDKHMRDLETMVMPLPFIMA
jgi:hypothetical protein